MGVLKRSRSTPRPSLRRLPGTSRPALPVLSRRLHQPHVQPESRVSLASHRSRALHRSAPARLPARAGSLGAEAPASAALCRPSRCVSPAALPVHRCTTAVSARVAARRPSSAVHDVKGYAPPAGLVLPLITSSRLRGPRLARSLADSRARTPARRPTASHRPRPRHGFRRWSPGLRRARRAQARARLEQVDHRTRRRQPQGTCTFVLCFG